MGKSSWSSAPRRISAGCRAAGSGSPIPATSRSSAACPASSTSGSGRTTTSPAAWRWQKREEYGNKGQGTPAMDGEQRTMWIFEPHVAERVFEDLVREHEIPVAPRRMAGPRDRASKRRRAIAVDHDAAAAGPTAARMFIDATYEGDLMAAAGVEYHVGREAQATYGETVERRADRRAPPSPPFRRPEGADQSVRDPGRPGERRAAAHQHRRRRASSGRPTSGIQAYCYRMCLTDHPGEPHPVPEAGGLRPEAVRTAAARLRGRLARDVPEVRSDSQPQDRHATTTARSAPTTSG